MVSGALGTPLLAQIDSKTAIEGIENDRAGWRQAISLGGKGTGHHANFQVIDDPIASATDRTGRCAVVVPSEGTSPAGAPA